MRNKGKIIIAYLMHGARNVGGGEYSIYHLITNLNRDRFEPIVFHAHENKITDMLKEEGIELIRLPFDTSITSVYRDEIKTGPTVLFSYGRHLIDAVFKTVRAIKKHNVHILHPHDNLSKIIGGMAAKIAGVKVAAHCRDLLTKSRTEKFLALYQLIFMNRVIAVSEKNSTVFKFGPRLPQKVRTIYNGIDLNSFVPRSKNSLKESMGLQDSDTVLGIIAVFDKCKGHIYLFQAIEKLLAEGREDISCIVAGDGREREALEEVVQEKGLSDKVNFLGYRKDIPDLLEAMDILVIPSIQESFPRVALEAMAMRVPVIASDVGGLPESVADNETGIIVPPEDVDALCRAMNRLIEDPEERKRMGQAGRKRAEKMFSLESNVTKTEALYLEMVGAI